MENMHDILRRDNPGFDRYYIIPDNKFTEDKTVVYDTPERKTTVNTVDYLPKEYRAVPQNWSR